MSWERDPLWAKSRLFFERAFTVSRDDPMFGLFCSFGLELLARAALASVSPTLLAEPEQVHRNLLHALNRGKDRTQRRSIPTARVFLLCQTLFEEFSGEDLKASIALVNRRNEELHSGAAPFDEYATTQWLAGFFRACQSLVAILGEKLETLFNEDEARVAQEVLDDTREEVRQRVESTIASYRKVFDESDEPKRCALRTDAESETTALSTKGHHLVECPACKCRATVQGTPYGKEDVTAKDREIVVRQPVTPRSFACLACGLRLRGYGELEVARLGGRYRRTTRCSPEDYYGLVDPDTIDPADFDFGQEYDNE